MNGPAQPKISKRGGIIFAGLWALGFVLQNYAEPIAQRLAPFKPPPPEPVEYLDVERYVDVDEGATQKADDVVD